MLSPMTTGPTGTYGGAYVGMGPLPMTPTICAVRFQSRKLVSTHDDRSLTAVSRTAASRPAWIRRADTSCGERIAAVRRCSPADVPRAIGNALAAGVGGAIGPGTAASFGYAPATFTLNPSAHARHAPPSCLAKA